MFDDSENYEMSHELSDWILMSLHWNVGETFWSLSRRESSQIVIWSWAQFETQSKVTVKLRPTHKLCHVSQLTSSWAGLHVTDFNKILTDSPWLPLNIPDMLYLRFALYLTEIVRAQILLQASLHLTQNTEMCQCPKTCTESSSQCPPTFLKTFQWKAAINTNDEVKHVQLVSNLFHVLLKFLPSFCLGIENTERNHNF